MNLKLKRKSSAEGRKRILFETENECENVWRNRKWVSEDVK